MHWFMRALASVASVTTALVLKPRSCLGCRKSLTELNPTEYFTLKLIAEGRHTAVEIHEAYTRQFGSISRQMINAALARLRDRGLVEVHGGGSTFIYRLTEVGRLIVG